MPDRDFTRLVSLACHDLRTPLATVNGFAKTLVRADELPEREARYLGMISEAADQLAHLLDELGLAARIEGDRYEPLLTEADTLDLASSTDGRIAAAGQGVVIETDAAAIRGALESLAIAAARHGGVGLVTWSVEGRELTLAPVTDGAGPVVDGESARDLGSLIARMTIERLGGSLTLDGEALRVRL